MRSISRCVPLQPTSGPEICIHAHMRRTIEYFVRLFAKGDTTRWSPIINDTSGGAFVRFVGDPFQQLPWPVLRDQNAFVATSPFLMLDFPFWFEIGANVSVVLHNCTVITAPFGAVTDPALKITAASAASGHHFATYTYVIPCVSAGSSSRYR